MASYDFNRILMGTAADSFSWERFFRELGLAALARKALGAGCNVMPSPLQSCAPPGGGSVANLSRHPFHTNPASQRRAKFVVSQKPDFREPCAKAPPLRMSESAIWRKSRSAPAEITGSCCPALSGCDCETIP